VDEKLSIPAVTGIEEVGCLLLGHDSSVYKPCKSRQDPFAMRYSCGFQVMVWGTEAGSLSKLL
jgi:hypothetical protein